MIVPASSCIGTGIPSFNLSEKQELKGVEETYERD